MPRERKQTETFAPEVSEPVKRAKKVSAIYSLANRHLKRGEHL